ncbi:MAG: ABC transporter permease [Gemmataceae bacterium]
MNLYRFTHTIRLGVRSLRLHRLRSALTTLGIVLGVGSVIVMLAVGEAARYEALKQLEDLGANTIVLRSVKPQDEPDAKKGADLLQYGLKRADLDRIRATLPTVEAATPMREFRKTVRVGNSKLDARIVTVTPDFIPQSNLRIQQGRGIEANDEDSFANVCVLGSGTAEKLFPTSDPIGRGITIEDLDDARTYVVVGVIEPKTLVSGSGTGAGTDAADFNRVVFLSYRADRARFGETLITIKNGYNVEKIEISQLTITVNTLDDVPRTANVLRSMMEQFHPNNDVAMVVPLDLLRKVEETQRLFKLVLGAIAGISLIVGGIGIMNIMLATVTERTKEIGIRRALGAKRKDIALQFLVEAVVLTCGGGVIGVFIGIGLAEGIHEIFGVPTMIKLWAPATAFAVSVIVGIVPGLYPAQRAANLDPIDALRRE